MGTFVVNVRAVGGHGCQRELKHAEEVPGCNMPSCPDCITREYVKALKEVAGCSVEEAVLTHWPGQPGSVVDNLLTLKRLGSF